MYRFSLKFSFTISLVIVSILLLALIPKETTTENGGKGVLRNFGKPLSIGVKATIVYCNWANTFDYQSYIWKSIYQARLINPTNRIVVITTGDAIKSINAEIMKTRVKALNVELIDFTSEYRNSSLIKAFEKVFFVHTDMVPIDGNPLFVLGSIVRIPIISVWMAKERVKHVFHLENDNTLYRNLNQMTETMVNACDGKGSIWEKYNQNELTYF